MVIMVMAAAGTARPVIMRMPLSLTVRMAVPFLPVPAAMFACFLKMPMIFFAMAAAVIFSLMTVAVAFSLMAVTVAFSLMAMTMAFSLMTVAVALSLMTVTMALSLAAMAVFTFFMEFLRMAAMPMAFFLPMAMPMAAVLSAMTVMVFMGMSHHFRHQFRFQILGSFDSLQNILSVQLLPRSSDDFGFPVISAEQSHTGL